MKTNITEEGIQKNIIEKQRDEEKDRSKEKGERRKER